MSPANAVPKVDRLDPNDAAAETVKLLWSVTSSYTFNTDPAIRSDLIEHISPKVEYDAVDSLPVTSARLKTDSVSPAARIELTLSEEPSLA